jgi:signal transduction histidine kinase
MKITRRIISGYGLLIAVLVGLVAYQSITVNRMRRMTDTLSNISFDNAVASLQAMRDMDLVEEYTQKSFALPDPDYREYLKRLGAYQRDFEKELTQLKSNARSGEEQAEVNRLSQEWKLFTTHLDSLQQNLPQNNAPFPSVLQDDLEQLKIQTGSVFDASKSFIKSEAQKSGDTARRAAYVLWSAAITALAISILVSYLIFRSISKPLASLTEGTRAIAEGKFFYRLDTSHDDEFSQLARDFNTMTRRLNELDELKKDFVSHVSHELKAPLASMRETIQLMLEEIPGPLTEKQKRLLTLSLQSGMRLTSMISNLLDLSKTEAGVMEYELRSQDLLPLVRNAVAELEVQAQEKQIQINIAFPDEPLPVECDGDRIVQVLVNLVGTAVNFSPKAGTVRVGVEAVSDIPESMPGHWRRLISGSARGGHFGLVTVADSGPGIPDSDKENIFEKFHQVKQGKKMAGQGVGLGLAICRTIVQAHRGAIWVEDNPGGGSRFRLLLRPGEKGEGTVSQASQPI